LFDKEGNVMRIKGKAWKYGDEIDTDVIYPGKYLISFDPSEAATHAMEGLDPDFHKKISRGDVLFVGRNFGSGSAREQAAVALKSAGVGAVIAESFARTFYRNAINIGLPALEFRGIKDKIAEEDEVDVDLDRGILKNITKLTEYAFPPQPQFVLEMLEMGGAIPYYKSKIGS
jgi:3-isopropylmalate/(R)-2-methylmalate dehydratase small subunit